MRPLHISRSLASHLLSVFLLLLWPLGASASTSSQIDTTTYETHADSARSVPVDSPYVPVVPIRDIGTIDRSINLENVISDTSTRWHEYWSLSDILAARPGVFTRDLGILGQYPGTTIRGLDGRTIAYFQDGVVQNEPLTGLYNAYWSQTEQIERIEFIHGTRAFLYGFNSSGGVVNSVTRSYKSIRPRTHIRYSESLYEQTVFDGLLSQNLTRTLNLTGGIQRTVTDGRFRNSDYDMWGTRAKLRWDFSSRLSVYLSENYTQTQLGLFGGVNLLTTAPSLVFNNLQASVVNADTYEKVTRHEVQLGIAAQLLGDTSDITTLTFYHSHHLREFRNEENRASADGLFIQDDHRTQWQGIRLVQHLSLEMLALDLGAEMQSRQVIESPAAGYRASVAASTYGKCEWQLASGLTAAGYARLENYRSRTRLSYGGDIEYSPSRWVSIFAGHARSFRFPTFQEIYWRSPSIDGPMYEPAPERHHLLEAGSRIRFGETFELKATAFTRIVHQAISTEATGIAASFPGVRFVVRDKKTYSGFELSSHLRIWSIFGEGVAQYVSIREDGACMQSLPAWTSWGGIYYWDKLLDSKLDLKLGVRGRVVEKFDGMEFNPEAMMFLPSSLPPLALSTVADAVLIAHVGNAYIHFIWLNLFDNDYVATPFYPMPDRALRFGISWEIMD